MRACVPACVCALQSDELFTTEASTEDLRNLRKELEESRYGEGCFVLWARLSAAGQQCRGTAVSGVACLRALSRKSSSSLPQDASAARARASRPGHDHVQLTENQGLDPQRESPRGLGISVKEKADGSVYINYMQKGGAHAVLTRTACAQMQQLGLVWVPSDHDSSAPRRILQPASRAAERASLGVICFCVECTCTCPKP